MNLNVRNVLIMNIAIYSEFNKLKFIEVFLRYNKV